MDLNQRKSSQRRKSSCLVQNDHFTTFGDWSMKRDDFIFDTVLL